MAMIRIPCSAPRYSRDGTVWAKLLRSVDPRASDGFGFEGRYLKPGSFVEDDKLWPSEDYPVTPVLLESAGQTGRTADGDRARGGYNSRSEVLFILWKFDIKTREWVEIARAKSDSAAWACELAPIAIRAIRVEMPLVLASGLDLRVLSENLCAYVLAQIERLPPDQQPIVVAVLHDQVAAWLSSAGGAPEIPFKVGPVITRAGETESPAKLPRKQPAARQQLRCPNCSNFHHDSESGNHYCGECWRWLRRAI